MPVDEPELLVGAPPHLGRRDDVEDGQLRHPVRVVEREAVRTPAAAVVAADAEALEPELPHHRDHVARHRALRVRLVVGRRRRLRALAVAAQVGRDHGVLVREPRRHRVPHRVRLRVPVEQEEGRPAAAAAQADRRLARVDRRQLEAVKHR